VGLGLGGLANDELLPSLVTLVDDLDGVLLRLGLTREGEDVLIVSLVTMSEMRKLTSGFPSGIL
jgi:hypothetical protein